MKPNHGEHGEHGAKLGRKTCLTFLPSYLFLFIPRVPRAPRGSFAQLKTGIKFTSLLCVNSVIHGLPIGQAEIPRFRQ